MKLELSDEDVKRLPATLDDIYAKWKDSTHGNWELGSEGMSGGWCGIYSMGEELVVGRVECDDVGEVESMLNAQFIVDAHENVPKLVNTVGALLRDRATMTDRIAALVAENERLTGALKEISQLDAGLDAAPALATAALAATGTPGERPGGELTS